MSIVYMRLMLLGNSYFPTRTSESEVAVLAQFRVSHALKNTTFPTSMERYFLLGNS